MVICKNPWALLWNYIYKTYAFLYLGCHKMISLTYSKPLLPQAVEVEQSSRHHGLCKARTLASFYCTPSLCREHLTLSSQVTLLWPLGLPINLVFSAWKSLKPLVILELIFALILPSVLITEPKYLNSWTCSSTNNFF